MSGKLTLFALCLFIVGFGLIVFSFVQLIINLRKSSARRNYSKRGNLWLRFAIFSSGIVLVILSQMFFWFNSNLDDFTKLRKDAPLARITFEKSEYEKSRMILETFNDENEPIIANEILLDDSLFQIETEIVRFKRLGNMFGLDEVYRFTRLIYLTDYDGVTEEKFVVNLGDPDNGVSSILGGKKKIITLASYKRILSDPLMMDTSKIININYSDFGTLEVASPENASIEE